MLSQPLLRHHLSRSNNEPDSRNYCDRRARPVTGDLPETPEALMGLRNPIRVVGNSMHEGVTWLSDELIREGAHNHALGSDGFLVMAYLLSRVSTPTESPRRRAWETSAAQITEQFGWGNRDRATNALNAAVKDRRLVKRLLERDGVVVARKCEYVVCSGGRRFTDTEWVRWTVPIVVAPKAHGKPAT